MSNKLLELLLKHDFTLAAAESCTGGLVSAAITDIPGISQVYQGSVTSYSNDIKMRLLNVPSDVLLKHGAVSEECAGFMAQGAAETLQAVCAVSTTGMAGPGGAVPGKPVGTVCIGYYINGRVYTETNHFSGSRSEVRTAAVNRVMARLTELLEEL